MVFSGIPLRYARRLLKIMSLISLKNRTTNKKTQRVVHESIIMSILESVRRLPHKRFKAVALVFEIIPMPRKAMPMRKENIIPSMFSGAKSVRSDKGPKVPATIIHIKRPERNGLRPHIIPRTAPAKAAWDIETPIKGIFISTTKTDKNEQLIPHKKEAIIALLTGRQVMVSIISAIIRNKSVSIALECLKVYIEYLRKPFP